MYVIIVSKGDAHAAVGNSLGEPFVTASRAAKAARRIAEDPSVETLVVPIKQTPLEGQRVRFEEVVHP